jgi:hypothetical protein
MRALTNILTGNAVISVSQDVTDYQNAVAAHVGGDWSQHNQMRLYSTPYAEPITGHTVANATLLRIQLTGTNFNGGGDGVFTVPAINSSVITDPGAAPIIIQEPLNTTVSIFLPTGFRVVVISASPVSYQWKKAGINIAGATGSVYIIPSAQLTDQGAYSVTATNAFGSTLSASATLTVTLVPSTIIEQDSGGDFNFGNLLAVALGVPPPLI